MHSSAALGVGRLTNSDQGRAGTPSRAKWRRVAALLLFALAGCSSPGAYTWVQNFAGDARALDLVSPGDMLAVRVFGQETMSSTSPRARRRRRDAAARG
ncbi:MAG: hypothetical protein QM756_37595 [Polyangiaceae bacterium]